MDGPHLGLLPVTRQGMSVIRQGALGSLVMPSSWGHCWDIQGLLGRMEEMRDGVGRVEKELWVKCGARRLGLLGDKQSQGVNQC